MVPKLLECGHSLWRWPWYCTRNLFHDGPCALHKKWWKVL